MNGKVKSKNFKWAVTIALVAFVSLGAAQVCASDLKQAVENALSVHPSLKSAKAEEQAAEFGQKIEQSYLLPDIKVRAEGGRIFQDNATSRGLSVTRGDAYSNFGLGSVGLYQTLFDGNEARNRIDAAQLRKQSLSYNFLDVEQNLILGVAQTYIDIIRIRTALDILHHQNKSVEGYKKRIADMIESGGADEAELQQATDVQMLVKSTRADYEGQLLAAEASYRELTGQNPNENLEKPLSAKSQIIADIEGAITQAKAQHPLLMSAHTQAAATASEVDAEKATVYPDLTGELSYLQSTKRDVIGGKVTDARALLKLNWNFSTGKRGNAAIDQKRQEQAVAQARAEQTEKQIERDIYQAYATYNTFKKKRDIAADRVTLNKDLLKSYELQFEGARISLLTLMRAQSQLFNAMLEYNDNDFFVMSAEYNILAMTGALKPVILRAETTKTENVAKTSDVQ